MDAAIRARQFSYFDWGLPARPVLGIFGIFRLAIEHSTHRKGRPVDLGNAARCARLLHRRSARIPRQHRSTLCDEHVPGSASSRRRSCPPGVFGARKSRGGDRKAGSLKMNHVVGAKCSSCLFSVVETVGCRLSTPQIAGVQEIGPSDSIQRRT